MKAFRHLLFLVALLPWLAAHAQAVPYVQDPVRQVHWAMGAFFGTGWYQVDDNRSVFVFRIPPRQTVRKSGFDQSGERRIGVEIRYPLTFGLHKLDDIPDFIEFENYGTISFTPGIELEIPVSDKWALRPYVNIGAGYEKESDEWAGIWYGGLKSRYLLGDDAGLRWSLLNAIYYGGYKPEYKSRGRYGAAMAGFEFSQPLGHFEFAGEPLRFNYYATYTYLFDKLNFHVDDQRTESIQDQWEIGLAFGHSSKKMKIWFMSFEQIGLSYKTSSNGHYKAISLNLQSPFTY